MQIRPPDILGATLEARLRHAPFTVARTLIERLRDAASRGMASIIRQSSDIQRRLYLASAPTQAESRFWVRQHGLNPDDVELLDALGESGQRWANRPVFERTLARAEAGQLGVLILPRHSRAGRSDIDTFRLIQALADSGGFMYAEGSLYDLSDPSLKSALKFQAIQSQQQIEQQTEWNIATKLWLAARRGYRIFLPPPLLWVPWNDDEYLQRLEAAGYGHWRPQFRSLPEELRAVSTYVDGESYRQIEYVPGPYPDCDVIRSAELRIRWFMETGSATEVERRIGSHPDWPRKGMVPMSTKRRWTERLGVQWVPVNKGTNHRWLGLPANFGIYSYTSRRTKRMPLKQRNEMAPNVWSLDAFPAWGTPDEYEQAKVMLSRGPRPKLKNLAVREGRLVKMARCSHPLRDGRVCGHALMPVSVKGEVEYRGSGCGFSNYRFGHPDAHATAIQAQLLDHAVMQVVAAAVTPAMLEEGIASFQLRADGALAEHHQLDEQLRDLEDALDAAGRTADLHQRTGNAKLAERARRREEELQGRIDALEKQRAAIGDVDEVRALARRELDAIRSLATSIPEIFAAAGQHPSVVREFLVACVQGIWVRRLAVSTFEVDVDFATGVTVRQVVRTRDLVCTQPQRAWAAARLAAGFTPAAIAVELNAVRVRLAPVPFTADRVIAAAEQFRLEAV